MTDLALVLLLVAPAVVPASAPPSEPSAPEAPAPPPASMSPDRLEALEQRMDALETANAQLEQSNEELQEANEVLTEEVELLEEDVEYESQRVSSVLKTSSKLTGYVDVGFFYVSGDGSGFRPDLGHRYFPQWAGIVPDSWVFMGDPLSVAINSRGEPAETAGSRAVVHDSVNNGGRASFIANALNLEYFGSVGDRFTVHGMVDFLPRNRDVSAARDTALGDFVDIKHVYMKWSAPTRRFGLDLYAGKIDPVIGFEYRSQESPRRITVSPSLLCRYTCGRPTGLKARSKFFDNALILNIAVTNGGSFWEGFGSSNDIDTNHTKTVSGRLSYALPLEGDVELGASGLYGAQDLQRFDDTRHWQAGADFHVQWGGVDFTAEYVQGDLEGRTERAQPRCNLSACLEFKGAYGLLGYRFTNWLMPYVRADWRDGLHLQGGSFVYISKLARVTGGARFDVGQHVILKGEYTYNHELGDIPQFRNDTFTTSAVAKF